MSDIKNSEVDFYIDDHAVLFGLVAKYSEKILGGKGLETCGYGVSVMARERGLRSAKRCIANGDELTFENYLCYARTSFMKPDIYYPLCRELYIWNTDLLLVIP